MKPSYWEDKNIFITGADGFLGSWLTKGLVERKANVTVLLRDKVPSSPLFTSGVINNVNIVNGDLVDYLLIERALNEYEIDTVFHVGAQTIVGTANRNPISTFKSNIEGTWNVLEAVRRSNNVKRLVIASSDKAYGSHDKLPYDEDTPLKGEHPYDVSKSSADLISQAYFKTYGIPVAITRCENIYGGGDLNFNRLIPGTIKSIYLKQKPIIRSDGKFFRGYIYLEDAVMAYLMLAGNLDRNEIKGNTFNFGLGKPIKVLDVVNLIVKLMKSKLQPVILNEASNEIREQYLSIDKAIKLLDWKPKYTLEEGLLKTINWYKDFFKNRYRN